ncbi:CLUMA_CG016305, isoform A [Clunio marinus]|uniref:CLUMA_CG016305, isoform A n=1 Tax=Clunio marinus TaxID=568069 RepID=A0A1J1IWR3_9DIPT|nr:CLUMA_CG016305, isoform A [Clunio marinus]
MADEVFKKIEARLTTVDPNDRKVVHIFKFIVTDESGDFFKAWVLDLKAVKIYYTTAEADDEGVEVTLKMKESTLTAILAGELDSTKALNDDMIDVEGNLELIYLLKPFISSV